MNRLFSFCFAAIAIAALQFVAFAHLVAALATEAIAVAFPAQPPPNLPIGCRHDLGDLQRVRSFKSRLLAREPDRQPVAAVRAFA